MTDRKNGSLYAKTPDYYRNWAAEYRAIAESYTHSIAAAPLLREADRYDHTADLIERVAAVKVPTKPHA